jgi:hypothetical protein
MQSLPPKAAERDESGGEEGEFGKAKTGHKERQKLEVRLQK